MAKFTATLALTRSFIAEVEVVLPDADEPWTEDEAIDYLFGEIDSGNIDLNFMEISTADDFLELVSCNLEEAVA